MALHTTPVPPPPANPPAPVTLVPVPQAAPAPQAPEGWWVQAVARMGTGWARLQKTGTEWLMAAELDDLDTAIAEVLVDRDRRQEAAQAEQHRDLRKLRRAITEDAEEGDTKGAARLGIALGAVAETGALAPTDAITRRDVNRLRWRRRFTRIGIVLAAGYGALTLTFHTPVIAPLELLGALAAVWIAGRPADADDQDKAAAGGPGAEQAAVDGTVPAARQEVELVPPFVTPVSLSKRDSARVRGEMDLIKALVKAGIIKPDQVEDTHVIGGMHQDGPGWSTVVELPRGVEAGAATSRVGSLASALRIKSVRIELAADTSDEGHEGRVRLWVANSDSPYGTTKTPSGLIEAPVWDFWKQGVPLGADARGMRQTMHLLWNSLLVGGLMGYGKSYFARLVAAAAALDPTVRIIVITGKTGPDWAPLKHVAHRWIAGATTPIIRDVLDLMDDVIEEMQDRGFELERLYEENPDKAPEGKITPELARDGMGPVLLLVDELQELLDGAALVKVAIETDDAGDGDRPGRVPTRSGKDLMVEAFARYVRVTRFVGGMGVFITQRPDANSVPTALREVCAKRASCRVKGDRSAKMVLGDDAVANGAAPHMLTEDSKGVVVLDQGSDDGHVTLKADVIDLPDFKDICLRGRDLREAAGTLTGDAAKLGEADRARRQARQILTDAIAVLDARNVGRARTERLVELLTTAHPDRYEGLTAAQLQARLRDAGAGTTRKLGAIDGMANPNGYTRDQLADALNGKGK
jgi:S-DNA-T family DNA segregation ATPase FtsK/SpoIIIE